YSYDLARGPVTLTMQGGSVHGLVHLSGNLQAQSPAWGGVPLQLAIDAYIRVEGTVALQDDWTLSPRLSMTASIQKADLPVTLNVLGQQVKTTLNVRGLIQSVLDGTRGGISDALNKAIAAVDLKALAQPYWDQLSVPLPVSSDPAVWLRISPSTIEYSGLEGDGTDLRVDLGTIAQVQCSVGRRPDDRAVGPMPNLTRSWSPGSFHLWLPINLEYAELNRYLSAELASHPFQSPENKGAD